MKIHYFIEEKRDQKRHQNLIKVEEKVKKHRSHKTKEKLICTPQISTKTRRFQLQNCRITEQLNANRSQPSLGPLSFTV
jgi:hypothetical protein